MFCKNCNNEFTITDEDQKFYAKIDVPEPTWCPECRLQRRFTFRNERVLYKRKCDFSGEEIISQYHQDVKFPIYDLPFFYSDEWEVPSADYDPSRSFFEQLIELSDSVPRPSVLSDLVSYENNSVYQNASSRNKNCYLVFASGDNEDCLYGHSMDYCKDSLDSLYLRKSELCYQCIDCIGCYNLLFSQDCQNCSESYFLFDCQNCNNCFGCVGLRGKSFCLFNQELSQEDYEKKIKKWLPITAEKVAEIEKKIKPIFLECPHKYARIEKSDNCTGDFIYSSKNVKDSFMVYDSQDSRYCFKLIKGKDCHDFSDWGDSAELCYECITVGKNAYHCLFCNNCWPACHDMLYSDSCSFSHDLFGCIGLRGKKYCILNKQYKEDEYYEIRDGIINDMKKRGEYGEFLPKEIAGFAYNETMVQDYFPLTENGAEKAGWLWRKKKKPSFDLSCITCSSCKENFKFVDQELSFYKSMKLPKPKKCPTCRHSDRMAKRNPMTLYSRECNNCQKEIQTTYAPDRPEKVYCEECYQKEIY